MDPRTAHPGLLFLLLAGQILAGCSASPSSKDPAGGSNALTTAEPPKHDEATCGIAGLVTDDEARPLAEAQVGLVDEPTIPNVLSAIDGSFAFSYLPPKRYTILATHANYEPATGTVVCTPGETVERTLQLTGVPDPNAGYFVIKEHRGRIGCAVGVPTTYTYDSCENQHYCPPPLYACAPVIPLGDLVGGNSTPWFQRDTQQITSLAFALQWSATSTLGGKYVALEYPQPPARENLTYTTDDRHLPNFPGGGRASIQGHSPVELRIEAPPGEAVYNETSPRSLRFEIRAAKSEFNDFTSNPMDDGSSRIMYHQEFAFQMAAFYNGRPIPADFTLLG